MVFFIKKKKNVISYFYVCLHFFSACRWLCMWLLYCEEWYGDCWRRCLLSISFVRLSPFFWFPFLLWFTLYVFLIISYIFFSGNKLMNWIMIGLVTPIMKLMIQMVKTKNLFLLVYKPKLYLISFMLNFVSFGFSWKQSMLRLPRWGRVGE